MVEYCEPAEVTIRKMRTAAKDHTCNECRRVIAKGEKYHWQKLLVEGSWFVNRQCAHCKVLALWLVKECGGYPVEGVVEDYEEHAREYKRFDMMRQLWGAKHKWQHHGVLMPEPRLLPTSELRTSDA